MFAILQSIRSALWGPVPVCCILATGLFFTVRCRLLQCHPAFVLRETLGSRTRAGSGVSPLRTLTAALGACMGTGNIAGVGAALLAGGAGALLWMCVSAFFGMMTSFAETVLAVRYRERGANGQWVGGAMFVLDKGLGMRCPALVYALLLTASSFGVGNLSQVSAAASAMHTAFGVHPALVSGVFAVAAALTVFGGIRRIATVTEKTVPILSALFLVCSLASLALHASRIPAACAQIVRDAFRFRAAAGGMVGQAVRVGVARGVFSNEAGLGSTAVIHAAADTDAPARQGMWGILEVFLDTVVMCTITGLVILTGDVPLTGTDGAALYAHTLSRSLGSIGGVMTALTLALLGFASMVGWSYCGERGAAYLCGERALPVFRALYTVAAFCAGFLHLDAVFLLSDICNALLAIPNLLSLWLLSGAVVSAWRTYKACAIGTYSHCRKKPSKKEEFA